MMDSILFLYFSLGLALGLLLALAVYVFGALKRARLPFLEEKLTKLTAELQRLAPVEAELKAATARLEERTQQNQALEEEKTAFIFNKERQEKELRHLRESLQEGAIRLAGEKEKLAEQKELLTNAEARLGESFTNLAQKILEEKGSKFQKSHSENLEKLLNPFQKDLEGFKKKVEEIHEKEAKELHLLKALNQK